MNRAHTAFAVVLLAGACTRKDDPASASASALPIPLVSASAPTAVQPPADISQAIERLGDTKQSVRDAAAEEIRKAITENPLAARDPGFEHWRRQLASLPVGTPRADFEGRLRGTPQRPTRSGGLQGYRLDDYWVAIADFSFDGDQRLIATAEAKREVRVVEPAEEPTEFTGTMIFYFVNGMRAREYVYVKGERVRATYHYENGRVFAYKEYANRDVHGLQWGEHRNGQRAYEGRAVNGKQHGRWVYFFEDGKKKKKVLEFVHGEQTGAAAWDEKGKLLSKTGSLADAGVDDQR